MIIRMFGGQFEHIVPRSSFVYVQYFVADEDASKHERAFLGVRCSRRGNRFKRLRWHAPLSVGLALLDQLPVIDSAGTYHSLWGLPSSISSQ